MLQTRAWSVGFQEQPRTCQTCEIRVKKLQSSRRVFFRHLKGHSGATSNVVADRAADRGRLHALVSHRSDE